MEITLSNLNISVDAKHAPGAITSLRTVTESVHNRCKVKCFVAEVGSLMLLQYKRH